MGTGKEPEKALKKKPSREELFTDREEFTAAFDDALTSLTPAAPKVLVFHGAPGIGKSEIKDELIRRLQKLKATWTAEDGELIDGAEGKLPLWAKLDFSSPEYRPSAKALLKLRQQFLCDQAWRVPFNSFDIAYGIKWRKINPETPFAMPSFRDLPDSGIINALVDFAASLNPYANIVVSVVKLIKEGPEAARKLSQWWTEKRSRVLQALEQAEPYQIDKEMPRLFGDDLSHYLGKENAKAVIFLDAYEKLFENAEDRATHRKANVDEWIRNLVGATPGVLWIITGHDALTWWDGWNGMAAPNDGLSGLEVTDLTQPHCYELLDRAGVNEEPIKNKIYAGSHGVPLYVDLSIDTYYKYKGEGKELNPDDFGGTFPEIYRRFRERLTEAEALTLTALAPARYFDRELFTAIVAHFKTGFPGAAFDRFVEFSFIKQDESGRYYFHDLLRDHVKDDVGEANWRERTAFFFAYYKTRAEVNDPKAIDDANVAALGDALYYAIETGDIVTATDWFNTTYIPYEQNARYNALIPLIRNLLAVTENNHGPNHPVVATILNNLASLYEDQGRYSDAEPLYERSLKIIERTFGPGNPAVSAMLDNLANLHVTQGRYDDAEPLFIRSLAISEKTLGPDHPSNATTLNNLARLRKTQGFYKNAETLYERCLKLAEIEFGPNHPSVATALNNLANLYQILGWENDAESLYKRSLMIYENALGPEHLSVAVTLNNLATLYHTQGRYDEAEILYLRGLKIKEITVGLKHPDVAPTFNNLANLYRTQDRYDEAEQYYLRDLEITEGAFGVDHPEIATTLNNLAGLLVKTGCYPRAKQYLERALAIVNAKLPEDHPNTIMILEGLFIVCLTLNEIEDATAYKQRAEELIRKREQPKNPG
jgi:tetratricopeptide (TPR) repeat protein